jgi:hypothetical protein
MQANVPFAWQTDGRQQNAGVYVISRKINEPVVKIENQTNGNGSFLTVSPLSGSEDNAYRLVFHRYGDLYFLAEIHAPGLVSARVPVTRTEKQLAESAAAEASSTGTSHHNRMTIVSVDILPSR